MKSVRLMRRINLGNYEHFELEVYQEFPDDTETLDAVRLLKEKVEQAMQLLSGEKIPFVKINVARR